MPERQQVWLPREGTLRFEEITRLVSLLATMGVHDVRLTGGEPLMRRDLPELVRQLTSLAQVQDLSLTTNGLLLERHIDELADAGLRRVNVSLDSLDPERYRHVTRRHGLERVLACLDALPRSGRLTRSCSPLPGPPSPSLPRERSAVATACTATSRWR